MKTDELIDLLARGAGPAPRAVVARRLLPAALAGLLLATALALGLGGPLPAAMFATPAPWLKLGYTAALAAAAAWWLAGLARPLGRVQGPRRLLAGVVVGMAVIGALGWLATPEAGRWVALTGHSWLACPFNVLGLSLPGLGLALWALRGLAPTRPRTAGAAAGWMAGALGAFGYAFSCTESAAPFVAVWYTLGIALCGGLGALLGPRLLRW